MLITNIDQVSKHHKRVAKLVDQYNFMSYGMGWFGQGWTSTTFAPLTGHKSSRPISIASTIQMYEDAGIPRSKLGMAWASTAWTMRRPTPVRTNNSKVSAVRWTVQLPVQGRQSGMWNGKYTLDGGIMSLQGADWNPDLAPGATNSDPGFCASR